MQSQVKGRGAWTATPLAPILLMAALLVQAQPSKAGSRDERLYGAFAADGFSGKDVECENPSENNGRGEHDWIVALQQRNGSLRYFVFVAPTPDFEKLRPTFAKMAQTIRLK